MCPECTRDNRKSGKHRRHACRQQIRGARCVIVCDCAHCVPFYGWPLERQFAAIRDVPMGLSVDDGWPTGEEIKP